MPPTNEGRSANRPGAAWPSIDRKPLVTHEVGIVQLRRDLAALDRADEIADEMEIDDEEDRLLIGLAAVLGARARA